MANTSTARKALRSAIELAIPHKMSTPEWAETYRVVDRGSRKGKWSNETVPFLTEIMAAADNPMVREIIFQASRQVGKSEAGVNVIGKRAHLGPDAEIAYVAEKEDKATAWTQESFDAMVRATPELRRIISNRSEENNQKYKRFPATNLYILWASSPAELSSRPFSLIIFDEKAAYKPTTEGDPVKIGEGSTKTYDGEELIMKLSTPRRCDCGGNETCGDITHDYERGDQREYYVPCPHCDEYQTLKFGGKPQEINGEIVPVPYGLKWDEDAPEFPYYLCEHCQTIIEEFDRDDMLAKGYWRASKPFNGVASFKINQIYSPFVRWGRLVVDFLESKTDIHKLEVFTNTSLGEAWKPVEMIEYEDLAWNLEQYPSSVPDGVLVLTAGVDIQKDRIEAEIVGWGKDNESWSIDYQVFYGSPGIEAPHDEDSDDADDTEQLSSVWDDLAEFLTTSFTGTSGQPFRVQCAGIDSGYLTSVVYSFCRKHARKRWFAVKGMSDPFKPLLSKPTKSGRSPQVQLFPIGTNAAKDEVFAALKVIKSGPGRCHFPDRQPYTEESHMKQLASEKMVTHTRGGRTYRVYEKVGTNVRNEALDVRVYATAARVILNPNYDAISRRRLQHGEAVDRPDETPENSGKTAEKPSKNNVIPLNKPRIRTINNKFDGYNPGKW
jgi:phage terminase large subunit GpA-like protein